MDNLEIKTKFAKFEKPFNKYITIYIIYAAIKGLLFLIVFVPITIYMMSKGNLPPYIGIPMLVFLILLFVVGTYQKLRAALRENTPFQKEVEESVIKALENKGQS